MIALIQHMNINQAHTFDLVLIKHPKQKRSFMIISCFRHQNLHFNYPDNTILLCVACWTSCKAVFALSQNYWFRKIFWQ